MPKYNDFDLDLQNTSAVEPSQPDTLSLVSVCWIELLTQKKSCYYQCDASYYCPTTTASPY